MALKKAMVLKLAVVALLLVAVSAKSGVDFFDLISSNNPDAVQLVRHKRAGPPCCDNCLCTRSIPPICRCRDIFEGLERCKNCEACICTRSIPPQCRCADITNFCHPKCKVEADDHHEAHVVAVEMIKQITSS